MSVDQTLRDCKAKMGKTVEHYDKELRGLRTGRATTALIDYVKVEYYGNPTDLKAIAAISVPEPTQLLVKPFDPGTKNDIIKALEKADLGLNPMADGATIRINVPTPSSERRQQLVSQVKKMAEESKVAIRNERRDAMKHVEQLAKDKKNPVSEDQADDAKKKIEEMTKSHITQIDTHCAKKSAEVQQV